MVGPTCNDLFEYMKLKGFTLIELLVVIAVIGIMVGVLASILNPYTYFNRANDAKRKSDIATIQSALEQYRADNSSYPAAATMNACGLPLTGTVNGTTVTYLSKIPCDPTTGSNYYYDIDTSGVGNYCLRGCLSSASDKMSDFTLLQTENANQCVATLTTCANPGSYTVVPQ